MKRIVVGIAEMKLSADPEVELTTYALGSCVAAIAWDVERHVGGMIHFMLPLSRVSPRRAERQPTTFCDTGVPLLFRGLYELGAAKERLRVTVVGGANLHDEHSLFQIGRRNYVLLRKLLFKNHIPIHAEDVGGHVSRTATLEVGTGRVLVRSQGKEYEL